MTSNCKREAFIDRFVGRAVIISELVGVGSFLAWILVRNTLIETIPGSGGVIGVVTAVLPLPFLILAMAIYISVRDDIAPSGTDFARLQMLVDKSWRSNDPGVRRKCMIYVASGVSMAFLAGINTANLISGAFE